MRKLFLSLLVITMTYGVSEAQIVNASQYFNHTSNSHLRGKVRLWKEGVSADSRVSHGLGTEHFHNTYGPGSAYASTIGHKFYVHGNEVVAQFGFGGSGVPTNRLTSYINGNVAIGTNNVINNYDLSVSNGRNSSRMAFVNSSYSDNAIIEYHSSKQIRFQHWKNGGWVKTMMSINVMNGNVGIGTTNPNAKLTVNGKVLAEEVEVVAAIGLNWPDYVFKSDYSLISLPEVEKFINKNHHLPGVPSEKEVKENGINLGKMDAVLLKKIEELTLYVIELKKENESLKSLAEDVKILQTKLDLNQAEK